MATTTKIAFRFTRHATPDGTGCRWSLCSVVAPEDRSTPGNRRCPSGCPASDVELDPDADPDAETDAETETCERCDATVDESHFDPDCGLCDDCSDHNASRVVL
jgi:hypothetical protein